MHRWLGLILLVGVVIIAWLAFTAISNFVHTQETRYALTGAGWALLLLLNIISAWGAWFSVRPRPMPRAAIGGLAATAIVGFALSMYPYSVTKPANLLSILTIVGVMLALAKRRVVIGAVIAVIFLGGAWLFTALGLMDVLAITVTGSVLAVVALGYLLHAEAERRKGSSMAPPAEER